MTEEQLSIAQANARRTCDKLSRRFPERLVRVRAGIFKKITKYRGTPLDKLVILYKAMDELYEFVNQFTPCQKACNSCCHYQTLIAEVEIQHIEKKIGVKRLTMPLPNIDFHGLPCPFLKTGACGIYEIRPFACRQHVSLCQTSTWCHPDRSKTAPFPRPNIWEFDQSFDWILHESGQMEPYDIRQVFGSMA